MTRKHCILWKKQLCCFFSKFSSKNLSIPLLSTIPLTESFILDTSVSMEVFVTLLSLALSRALLFCNSIVNAGGIESLLLFVFLFDLDGMKWNTKVRFCSHEENCEQILNKFYYNIFLFTKFSFLYSLYSIYTFI